jgi:hypothetical protein
MVSIDISEERRRRRRAGDPRLSTENRAILRRLVKGDLAEESGLRLTGTWRRIRFSAGPSQY